MNWEIGIDLYTLMCVKWMTNKKINKYLKKLKKIFKWKKKKRARPCPLLLPHPTDKSRPTENRCSLLSRDCVRNPWGDTDELSRANTHRKNLAVLLGMSVS